MLFNSIEFLIFLPLVFFGYWFVFKSLRWQNLFVVAVSYLFYGWWDWRFLLLILFTSLCSYLSVVYLEKTILNPKEGAYGAEIKAGTWHGLLVLESGSVIYEIKQGPFAPLAPENLAPWSPEAEDTEGVKKYLEWLESKI